MQPPNQPPWPPGQGQPPQGYPQQQQPGYPQQPQQQAYPPQQQPGYPPQQQQQAYPPQQQPGYPQQQPGYPQQPQQQAYPPQQGFGPQPGQAPPKKGNPLLWVGLGVGALVVFGSVIGVGVYFYKQSEERARTEKLARLCVEAGDMLREGRGSGDTFKLMLENALEACSGACDGQDSSSCRELDGHLTKICGVSPSICSSLCTKAESPSLRETSCKHK
jgi:hypothetical protein